MDLFHKKMAQLLNYMRFVNYVDLPLDFFNTTIPSGDRFGRLIGFKEIDLSISNKIEFETILQNNNIQFEKRNGKLVFWRK